MFEGVMVDVAVYFLKPVHLILKNGMKWFHNLTFFSRIIFKEILDEKKERGILKCQAAFKKYSIQSINGTVYY